MKKATKLLALALSLCLMLSAFTFTVFAETQSGTCGENLTWTLDENGTLTISGEGDMEDYYEAPWGNEINSVVIGDSVTSIGECAFAYCYYLKSATIGKSVESIGVYAFFDCEALEQIVIPDSVKEIGMDSFSNCLSLKSVTIGSGLETVDSYAFDYCPSLESITVSPLNNTFHSSGNCLIETETKTLIKGGSTGVIPSDGSVEVIGNSAFYGCTVLESITIPNTILEIDEYAFGDCESLKDVIIPDSVVFIGDNAFSYCVSLESVKIGNSVEEIDYEAFYGCISLKEINIPDSVKYLRQGAFDGCVSAEKLTIGSGVQYIDFYVFDNCYSIEKITVSPLNEVFYSAGDCLINAETKTLVKGCKNSVIPGDGSIEVVGDSAFYGCYYLESVIIPEGIKTIEPYAFGYCPKLNYVELPDSLEAICEYAFADCELLLSISVPATVASIGEKAIGYFYDYDIDDWNIVDGFTIESVKGTAAEEYATINGIAFVESVELPDVDDMEYMDKSTMTMPNVVELTTAETIISRLSAYGINATITDKNGNEMESTAIVGTGCKVTDQNGNTYTVIVKGDTDGSGEIDATDYIRIKSLFLGKLVLEEEYLLASDTDDTKEIDATDYLRVKGYFLGAFEF